MLLGVSDDRVHRWRRRRADGGALEERRPGRVASHALRPGEVEAILAVVEEWGPMDRSSRKLAHRGSYEGRVWVSPSTVRRVLAAHGLVLPEPPARDPAPRPVWPDWLDWQPNKIWCWDVTHFGAARRAAFAIVDVVSRRWIATHLSIEETSTQVRVLFESALGAEGLTEHITPERVEDFAADATQPILLAASDNGPQTASQATREFFAALAVAQRLGPQRRGLRRLLARLTRPARPRRLQRRDRPIACNRPQPGDHRPVHPSLGCGVGLGDLPRQHPQPQVVLLLCCQHPLRLPRCRCHR